MFLGNDQNLDLVVAKRKNRKTNLQMGLIAMLPGSPIKDKLVNAKHALNLGEQANVTRRLQKMTKLPSMHLKSTLLFGIVVVFLMHVVALTDDIILKVKLDSFKQESEVTDALSSIAPSFSMLMGLLYSYYLQKIKPNKVIFRPDDLKLMISLKDVVEQSTAMVHKTLIREKLKEKESICNDIYEPIATSDPRANYTHAVATCMWSINDIANFTYLHGIESFIQFFTEAKQTIDSGTDLDIVRFMDSSETAKIDVMSVYLSTKLFQYRVEYYNQIKDNLTRLKSITTVLVIVHCLMLGCFAIYFRQFWIKRRLAEHRKMIRTYLVLHDNILNNNYVKAVFF